MRFVLDPCRALSPSSRSSRGLRGCRWSSTGARRIRGSSRRGFAGRTSRSAPETRSGETRSGAVRFVSRWGGRGSRRRRYIRLRASLPTSLTTGSRPAPLSGSARWRSSFRRCGPGSWLSMGFRGGVRGGHQQSCRHRGMAHSPPMLPLPRPGVRWWRTSRLQTSFPLRWGLRSTFPRPLSWVRWSLRPGPFHFRRSRRARSARWWSSVVSGWKSRRVPLSSG